MVLTLTFSSRRYRETKTNNLAPGPRMLRSSAVDQYSAIGTWLTCLREMLATNAASAPWKTCPSCGRQHCYCAKSDLAWSLGRLAPCHQGTVVRYRASATHFSTWNVDLGALSNDEDDEADTPPNRGVGHLIICVVVTHLSGSLKIPSYLR